MWVTDTNDDKIYAYNLSTKARDSGKDFDTLSSQGNQNPTSITSDGTIDVGVRFYRQKDLRLPNGRPRHTIAAGTSPPP